MDLHPEIGMTHTDYVRMDESGKIISKNIHSKPDQSKNPLTNPPPDPPSNLAGLVRKSNTIGLLTVMIRKHWLEKVGGFDPKLQIGEDLDLWLRLAQNDCHFSYIDEVLGFWRRHLTSISKSQTSLGKSHIQIFEKLLSNLGSTGTDQEIRLMVKNRVVREKAYLCREYIKRGQRTKARDLALDLLKENQSPPIALILLTKSLLPLVNLQNMLRHKK